jgi:hypothetical protein
MPEKHATRCDGCGPWRWNGLPRGDVNRLAGTGGTTMQDRRLQPAQLLQSGGLTGWKGTLVSSLADVPDMPVLGDDSAVWGRANCLRIELRS